MKNKKLFGALLGLGLTTLSSQGAIVVYFEQVGNDVVASWEGQIFAGTWSTWNSASSSGGSSNQLYHTSSSYDIYIGGSAATTSLSAGPDASTFNGGVNDSQFWINGPTTGTFAPSSASYTFDKDVHKMTWTDTDLASIGADSFDNTLAWTSLSGGTNTISYTTVPEPTSTALLGLGAMSLLIRRKR